MVRLGQEVEVVIMVRSEKIFRVEMTGFVVDWL